MTEEVNLQDLEKEAWELKKKFLRSIEAYRSPLWNYCLMLTRSPWDAEDLVQDTLMKAMASLGQIWQPVLPKSYLFRIATNTWINQCRKFKKIILNDELSELLGKDYEPDQLEVRSSIEFLVNYLSPKQVAIILLIDVFDFTAREAAELMGTTEGAIKATLHRSRTKLKTLSQEKEEENMKRDATKHNPDLKISELNHNHLIDQFVEAFNRRDMDRIAGLLTEHARTDIVHVGQEFGRETIRKYSLSDFKKHPEWVVLKAFSTTLWEMPVVVIAAKKETGLKLVEISTFEYEEDKITTWKTYCFCKDLLQKAGKVLNLEVHDSVSHYPV